MPRFAVQVMTEPPGYDEFMSYRIFDEVVEAPDRATACETAASRHEYVTGVSASPLPEETP